MAGTSLAQIVSSIGKESGATHEQLDTLVAGANQIEQSIQQFESFAHQMATSLEEDRKLTAPVLERIRQELAQQQSELEGAIQRASDRLTSITADARAAQAQLGQGVKGLESDCAALKQVVDTAPGLYEAALKEQLERVQVATKTLKASQIGLEKQVQLASVQFGELTGYVNLATREAVERVGEVEKQLSGVGPALDGQLKDFTTLAGREVGALAGRFGQLVQNYVTAPVRKAKDEAKTRINKEVNERCNTLVERVVNEGFKTVFGGVANANKDGGSVLADLKNIPTEMTQASQKLKWLAENMSEILRLLGKSITQAIQKKGRQFIGWLEQKTGLDLAVVKDALDAGVVLTNMGIDLGADLLNIGVTALTNPAALGKELKKAFGNLKANLNALKDKAKQLWERAKRNIPEPIRNLGRKADPTGW